MFIKYLGYTVTSILILLITFFGLGPVIFADGSLRERLITLLVVLLIYFMLAAAFYYFSKKYRAKK